VVSKARASTCLGGLTTPYKNTCFDYLLRCLRHGGTRGLTAGYKGQGGTKRVYKLSDIIKTYLLPITTMS